MLNRKRTRNFITQQQETKSGSGPTQKLSPNAAQCGMCVTTITNKWWRPYFPRHVVNVGNALGLITFSLQVCLFSFTGGVLIETELAPLEFPRVFFICIIYSPIYFARGVWRPVVKIWSLVFPPCLASLICLIVWSFRSVLFFLFFLLLAPDLGYSRGLWVFIA